MTDTRHKDATWSLPENPSLDYAKLAVLMDIRDELKALNHVLHCVNFLAIPRKLDDIVRNTKKKPRKKHALTTT
jgi:hypothetical protein